MVNSVATEKPLILVLDTYFVTDEKALSTVGIEEHWGAWVA